VPWDDWRFVDRIFGACHVEHDAFRCSINFLSRQEPRANCWDKEKGRDGNFPPRPGWGL